MGLLSRRCSLPCAGSGGEVQGVQEQEGHGAGEGVWGGEVEGCMGWEELFDGSTEVGGENEDGWGGGGEEEGAGEEERAGRSCEVGAPEE